MTEKCTGGVVIGYDYRLDHPRTSEERVQELIDFIQDPSSEGKSILKELQSLREENKLYKLALEFYANQENWSTGRFSEHLCKAEYDGGDIAQSALNGGK